MKAIIILGDGMSDHPVVALQGKTPLMVARTPHMDRIAREGRTGRLVTIPEGMPNGSAVANLSVLGYDPQVCYRGRGVLEAASMQIALGDRDVAMRCNLICVTAEGTLRNHSAGHISTTEAATIMADLDRMPGGGGGRLSVRFHPGVSYRHLLVLSGMDASADVRCAPPHDHVGESVAALMPRSSGPDGDATVLFLNDLSERARALLREHPINQARLAKGQDPANAIWPWSPGTRPEMQTLKERYGISGAVISAVDLVQGLGVLAGMEKVIVEGATGLYDTNYEGKAEAALEAITRHDLVYVHVEATDEAGHARDLDLKIRCIEYLDQRLIRLILEGLEQRQIECAVAVLPDHPTPVETGVHASDPVPVAIRMPGQAPDSVSVYDEDAVVSGALGLMRGDQFLRSVLALNRGG